MKELTHRPVNQHHCYDYDGFKPFDYGDDQDNPGGLRRVIKMTLLHRLEEFGREYCSPESCRRDPFGRGTSFQDVIYLSIDELKDLFTDEELEEIGLSRE